MWLVLENEFNQASLLQQGFDAQWNDDGHNALHVLLTGETDAYYADLPTNPPPSWPRCLGEGFIYQGETTRHGTRVANPAGTCRPVPLCCFCRTTTRSATAPSASACINSCSLQALQAATTLVADVADDPAAVHGR